MRYTIKIKALTTISIFFLLSTICKSQNEMYEFFTYQTESEGYKSFLVTNNKKEVGEYLGERKRSYEIVNDRLIVKINSLKTGRKKYQIKDGNGYFMGCKEKISIQPSENYPDSTINNYYKKVEEINYRFLFSINSFLDKHKDLNFRNNLYFFNQLTSCYDLFLDAHSPYNYLAGHYKNGYADGQWVAFNLWYRNDTSFKYTIADTNKRLTELADYEDGDNSYRGQPNSFYSFGNYLKGVKTDKWTEKVIYNQIPYYLKGEYINGKREGLWTMSPSFKSEEERKTLVQCYKITLNYKNGLLDGIISFINPDGIICASFLFKENQLVRPILLTNQYNPKYIFYRDDADPKNNASDGKFFTPFGDVADYAAQVNNRFYEKKCKTKPCITVSYSWKDDGTITFEKRQDENGFGFYMHRFDNYIRKNIHLKDTSIWIETSFSGDTTDYNFNTYRNKKSFGHSYRKRPDGTIDYFVTNDSKKQFVKRVENGKVTMLNGEGYVTESPGVVAHYKNYEAVDRVVKRGKEESYSYFKNGEWFLKDYTDSLGNQTVKDGFGYKKVKPYYETDAGIEYFINGKNVWKVRYDMYNNPKLADTLSYYAKRTITEVAPNTYMINYKAHFPYNWGRVAVMDTFPCNIKILHVGTPANEDFVWYSNNKKVLELFGDDDFHRYEDLDQTCWIQTDKKLDEKLIKGSFFFSLEFKTKQISISNTKKFALKQILSQRENRYDVTNSFLGHDDYKLFIPNSVYQEKNIDGFLIQREVYQDFENKEKYYFNIKIRKIDDVPFTTLNYKETLNTNDFKCTYVNFIPLNYNDGRNSGNNISCLLYDKNNPKNRTDLLEWNVNLEVIVNDDTELNSLGLITIDGNKTETGIFESNEFNPLYKEKRGLSDEEYRKILNDFPKK